MPISHGVWGSPFKGPLLSALEQFLVCSEKECEQSFTSHRISSKGHKC